jgi:hypothetical protein
MLLANGHFARFAAMLHTEEETLDEFGFAGPRDILKRIIVGSLILAKPNRQQV